VSPGRLPVPTQRSVALWSGAAALAALALLLGAPLQPVMLACAGAGGLLIGASVADVWLAARAWAAAPLQLQRRLPAALALGVARELPLTLVNPGNTAWQLRLHDHPDGRLHHRGLPLQLSVPPKASLQARYGLEPTQRGTMAFQPAELRLATPWRLFELRRQAGKAERLRVYPNFAEVARYAWLAGDRRLSEIGIKSYAQRGEGTDFKELAEYRPGDDVRHIDWKATLRFKRPIVREFQDERDQCVMFLLDCGRRMRAAEDEVEHGSHFDHALNALMLLAYVALASGDAVGAMTYGSAPEHARHLAPRKGRATLQALTAALHDVQPQAEHADLQAAATRLMRQQQRRALVVVLTNFRDEDAEETAPALALLRTRHLVLLASLREQALGLAINQPLADATAARRIAAAHGLDQARRDAFARLSARNALMVDSEPQALPAALVNRYHAVKRSGLL
jgi:uncharacterized protein (DUF58 family)